MSVQELMTELTTECCVDLFDNYGVQLSVADVPRSESVELAGIIGFTNPNLRGAMILGSSTGVLERTQQGDAQRRDWVAELANQLLGRVKNRLVARGVDVEMTTPLSIRGRHLTVGGPEDGMTVLDFSGDLGPVRVWIDLEQTGEIEIRSAEDGEAVAAEGDMMLF